MIRTLKNLIGLAARTDAPAAELAPSLPQAEAELAAAHEAQAAAEAAYKGKLLTADDATLRQLVEARTDAGVRVDRATALVEALRERLEAAQTREAEAARVTAYEAAHAQAEEARAALVELYPGLARDLMSLMRVVAEAEIAVQAANADLPAGAAPIAGVEASVRDLPGVPETVLSETYVERWVEVGKVTPGSFDQHAVQDLGRGQGVIKIPGIAAKDCRPVERRGFLEQRVYPASLRRAAYGLAERLALPGLRVDDPAFWEPASGLGPRQVLSKIAARDTASVQIAPAVEAVTRLVSAPGAAHAA